MQFELIVTLGWISIMMLVGTFLRAKIKFLQKSLIPSSIIGGIIGLILINVGAIKIPASILSQIVFHLFVISFIAIGLMDGGSGDSKKEKKSLSKNPLFKASIAMACIYEIIRVLQALLGYGTMQLLNKFGISDGLPLYGMLLPSGFASGPGQAAVFGSIYAQGGYDQGVAIGLAFAATGFLACFAIGIPVANIAIRKGIAKASGKLSDEFLSGVLKKETKKESAGDLTFHSANIETLSVHIAIILGVYLASYYIGRFICLFVSPQVATTIMGMVFVFALLVANILKPVMLKMKINHLVSPPLMKRIAGWAIDYMVLTTIMAVKIQDLGEYLIPVLIIALLGSIMTAAVMYYFGRRIGGEVDFERSLGVFGQLTGTLNTGLLLLRVVDPDFNTTAPQELALNTLIADVLIGGLPLAFVLLGPFVFGWSEFTTLLVILGFGLAYLILLKVVKGWGKPTYSLFNKKSSQKEFLKGLHEIQE